jgi:hypothetical protein
MRTREEIENSKDAQFGNITIKTSTEKLILEVLLDIRDLLSSKEKGKE